MLLESQLREPRKDLRGLCFISRAGLDEPCLPGSGKIHVNRGGLGGFWLG